MSVGKVSVELLAFNYIFNTLFIDDIFMKR